jgi:peptidase E
MKLFLASEGSDPRTVEKLEKYVGGFKSKNVIYIPTAKNGNGEGRWETSSTWKFLVSSGMKAQCLQLEHYLNGITLTPFKNVDLIWVTGGAPGYLMYWVRRTGFDKILPELLKKSIYVGSSAGSMIMSKTLEVCEWYIGEPERGAKYLPGLGYIDFDFYPHYQDNLHEEIGKRYKGKKMYLLKNGEVILVEDKKVQVLGKERIITGSS